jgi:hypothetical protein
MYLHAGGHLHGKVASVPNHLRTYRVPIPVTITAFEFINTGSHPIEIKEGTYERVDTVLFGRSFSVYVLQSTPDVPELLFDVVASSVVKAVI